MNTRTAVLLAFLTLVASARAWDFDGHRLVNQLALASLPSDFPAFVREPARAERIAWLSGEPDRWRSAPELPARHGNAPDHYLDFEQFGMAGLSAATVSSYRYEFAAAFASGRAANLAQFPAIDPAKNSDHTREWMGFLPWAIAEHFGKLRANIARLKVLEEFGQADEAARTRESIVEIMGVMGHYVGDAAQPLHTTIHHNGWVGANPEGYTTWDRFHSWIDGGFLDRAGRTDLAALKQRVGAAGMLTLAPRADDRDPAFALAMDYVQEQHRLVEPTYRLEKAGKFRVENTAGAAEGRAFLETQLVAAGRMLGSLWLTAWRATPPDSYLRGYYVRLQAPPAAPAAQPKQP